MKKMGIQQVEIPATEVIIRTADSEIVIAEPQVSKINMMGQVSYQVTGEAHESPRSSEPEISHEDIETVMEQAGVSEAAAKKAIAETKGDLAQAILSLKQE